MSTSEVSPDVDSNGVMVVHGSNGDESYVLTKTPPPTSYLVQNAKKDILKGLGLQSVLTDLNRASDLLYLAYLGVIGTGDLHARISSRQKELSDLCGRCVATMTALGDGSRIVLDRLTEAYSYLLEANENRAMRILSRCAKNAGIMATNCADLALKFQKLKDDTKQDAETAIKAWGDEVKKIKEFENLRAEMEAALKKQEELTRELNEEIEEMKIAIAKGEAKEEAAEKREFTLQIIGAVAGALGVCASSMGPYKMNPPQGSSVPAGPKEASGDTRPNLEQSKIRQEEKANAQKVNEEAKMAETKAGEREREPKAKVSDAKTDNKAKQDLLNEAKATNTADAGNEEKVRETQTAFDASSTTSKLREEPKQAEEDLPAKKSAIDAKAALEPAVAPLDNIASTANTNSQQHAHRATMYVNNRIELVKQKRVLQELRREAIGQVASLTSRLDTNKREINVKKSAQTALEIATWALNNIYVSLSNAKEFWDNIKKFCEKLADPKMIEQIDDETADGSSPEKRIKFYKSRRFVEPGIAYISQWTALAVVCDEYAVASQHARKSVLGNIKASPNAEEARKLIEPLKKQLQDELGNDAVEADFNINSLDTETKQLEAEKAAIKAEV
ncbi:unnamed protein product [Sphagnum jensenii]|uniref:Uncharacterized protein n=1 Tax=Sphagnum jensenii TaxID=128206 RepID=A0ABP1A4L5_9BRYO